MGLVGRISLGSLFLGWSLVVGCKSTQDRSLSGDSKLQAVYDEGGYYFKAVNIKDSYNQDKVLFETCFVRKQNRRVDENTCVPSFLTGLSSDNPVTISSGELKKAMSPEERKAVERILYDDLSISENKKQTMDQVHAVVSAAGLGALVAGALSRNPLMGFSGLAVLLTGNVNFIYNKEVKAKGERKVRGWLEAQQQAGLGEIQDLEVLVKHYSVATDTSAGWLSSDQIPSVKVLLHDLAVFFHKQQLSSARHLARYCYPCKLEEGHPVWMQCNVKSPHYLPLVRTSSDDAVLMPGRMCEPVPQVGS